MTSPAPVPAPPVSNVSVLDVYTEQIKMGGLLAVINEKLADLPDHEKRIRVLEASRAKIAGACLVLSVMAGGGAGWVAIVLTHR